MENIEMIIWNSEYDVGVDEIDEQHHILVNTINEANEKLTNEYSLENLESITRDLLSYALYHFETEEEMMTEYNYNTSRVEEYENHMKQHRAFSAQVVEVRDSLKSGSLISREDLVGFLKDWLINHINKTDKKLAKYLLECGAFKKF